MTGPVAPGRRGRPFGAETALECGLVNGVLPPAEVLPHARRIAERFNALPPSAVRESKRLMRRASQAAVQDAISVEAEVFGRRLKSPEAAEAMQAFFEKRKPDFSKF